MIEQYPNFWVGLHQRASCYRKLGMTKQAETDEFRILKAQMDKRMGKQPRLSKKQMRKRSDEDIEKYNQLAVADEQQMEPEYKSDYRGKVQNRRVALDYMPMYVLSTEQMQNAVKHYVAYDRLVDQLNTTLPKSRRLYIVCGLQTLSEAGTHRYFARIDSLSQQIAHAGEMRLVLPLLLQRAVAYSVMQNYEVLVIGCYRGTVSVVPDHTPNGIVNIVVQSNLGIIVKTICFLQYTTVIVVCKIICFS